VKSKQCLCLTAILVFGPSATGVGAETVGRDFGPELPIVRRLGLGESMDAAVKGDTLYIIGRGRLYVADISQPTQPKIIGRLTGLGNTRQIEIHRGAAYVTAREDGLFIIDVTNRDAFTLMCHYDSIELATGIALSGDVAFIACRTAGVELVDISNPRQPVHLSTVRTGEAQSVAARNGLLYAGVWGTRQLVICDVRDPYRPTVISRTPLDGYGDGVAVRGSYCFVATGHHARGWRRDEGTASLQYGAGHGLEIFDVSDPANPQFVSRIKTRRFYRIGMDMWDVMLAGHYAFLGDTYNGVFVIDIANIREPRFVGHRQLAPVPRTIDGLDTGESLPAPVGGIALAKDTLYVAGAWTDLHVVDATGMARAPARERNHGPTLPGSRLQAVDPRFRVYRPEGQVYSVAFLGDMALSSTRLSVSGSCTLTFARGSFQTIPTVCGIVAAGAAGLHAVSLWPAVRRLSVFPTDGFARDVAVHGDQVYVAEASGGLSIWQRDRDVLLKRVGRYRPKRGGVAQVVVPPPGRYALLHVGQNELQILDVSNPREPTRMLTDKHLGLFYTFPLARDLLDDRYACCLWHASGYRWYDLYGGSKPVYSGDHFAMRANFADGIAAFGNRALLVTRGKYTLISHNEKRPPDEWTFHGTPGTYLSGKPTINGDTMYLSNRVRGTIMAVDISQIESPRLLADLQLEEHPGPIVVHNNVPVIPAGYQGLLVWDQVGSEPRQNDDQARRLLQPQFRK